MASSGSGGGKRSRMEVDRISNLPGSVLCHILSFLDTQMAVRTCVLSKRWKSVYADVPRLSFRCPRFLEELITKKGADFDKLVTTCLLMNRCQSLDSFNLVCLHGAERLNLFPAWLSTVVTKNVRFLDLNLVSKEHWMSQDSDLVTLPSCIFTSKSLEILKLDGDLLVRISGLVSLPRLECLTLNNVKYDCEESFRKLIGGCPVLKSLYIKRNRYDNVVVFSVFSDTLERLQILAGGFDYVNEYLDLKLEIKAPFLKYFRLCDYVSKNFSLGTLPNLYELHLFDFDDDLDTLSANDSEILDCYLWVPGLVDETLGKELKILSIGTEKILDVFAESKKVFSTLTNLILTSLTWEWTSLLQLLRKTENLKFLKLKNHCREFNGKSEAEEAPVCFLSSLKSISVISWLTCPRRNNDFVPDCMVGMVEYFLKHGGSLHQFNISHTYINAIDKYLRKCRKYPYCSPILYSDGDYLDKYLDLSRKRSMRRRFIDILLGFSTKSRSCDVKVVYK